MPRSGTKIAPNPPPQPIIIHDSDSEPETSRKRQKISDSSMSPALSSASCLVNLTKNSTLKGRKRFNTDLNDLKDEAKAGLSVHGLVIKRAGPGDDEGAFEVVITKPTGEHVLALNFLVSDTADYPKGHSFFSYSPDSDVPSKVDDIVQDIASAPSLTIGGVVMRICTQLAKVLGIAVVHHESQEADADEESGDDYEPFDDFDGVGHGSGNVSNIQIPSLQNDFVDIVASQYRPGIIPFGADDFCLSISLPVISLAESIPPRALMAWDRHLLSKTQHLVLLISGLRGIYPIINSDGSLVPMALRGGVQLNFKVGLSGKYKPSKENAREACRNFGLIVQDAEDELRIQAEKVNADAASSWDDQFQENIVEEEPEPEGEGRFDKFSLSTSLESLLNQAFLKVIQLRRTFGLGWAGAEMLYSMVEKSQKKAEDVMKMKSDKSAVLQADRDEQALMTTNNLPHDPLHNLPKTSDINLPLTAFCYLVRRLTLCNRFCIVCHNKITADYEVLKPYVCESKLCEYQYYSLNRGPSLEYEILRNPLTVDLLVCMAYAAAAEGAMDDPLPIGMGLRVPLPAQSSVVAPPISRGGQVPVPDASSRKPVVGNDGLVDFDDLDKPHMRAAIATLINSLPSIDDMRKHLLRKVKPGKSKPKLKEIDPNILPAAWQLLRWIVGSCTAYLEDITSSPESVRNLDPSWRQFRITVGAPDAETKFAQARETAVAQDANAKKYPSLYAFHGSPMRNWHSIIRHGLWFKNVANGRAYGDGVYLAKDANISMSHYAAGNRSGYWNKSKVCPTSCVALAEAVNLPSKFVSSNPYFVIAETSWIICRYFLVKGAVIEVENVSSSIKNKPVPFVNIDPLHQTVLAGKSIEIPVPGFEIDNLLKERQEGLVHEDADADDQAVFEFVEARPVASRKGKEKEVIEVDDSDVEMFDVTTPAAQAPAAKSKAATKLRPADDWKHDPKWVEDNVAHLFPPPVESSPGATMAVQRELKSMLKEQESCSSYKELGWYMPPDRIGDNLFQWIVEMHSFDPAIPIAKDLTAKNINSIVFEIRFPPNYPLSPPFFRIITPRFLPFIQGGGGHVTGGGSICMDLLTADGWLPSYSIPAVLMQIKLAISNLEPRPARLAQNWNQNYGVQEALEGYRRAAATHGWQVPLGLEKLVR